ncbi:carbon-nitrogen hydrolase family protein [Rhodovibrionaceae bacterium A322]
MKVTVCQLDNRPEELVKDLARLAEHVKENESDFLLVPEMSFSRWLAADKNPDADKWAAAVESHNQQIEKLHELNAKAVMGTRPIVNDQGSRRNLAYIWTPENGAQGVHEKFYMPDEEGYWEHTWYDRGVEQFDLCRALGMRIGVQICTEMWFFEWARHYGRGRADLLCVPRATPHGSLTRWLAGGQAAAASSGAYCLSSNLWAPEGDFANCGGLGWIIDPEANILAQTTPDDPFATVEIDLDFARHSKTTYPRYVPE